MTDETEYYRRELIANNVPEHNAAKAVATMSTDEMQEHYIVLAFMAPYVIVRRKRDNKNGTLEFTHSPRRYFNWQADDQTEDEG
jgi:hypothetical protein